MPMRAKTRLGPSEVLNGFPSTFPSVTSMPVISVLTRLEDEMQPHRAFIVVAAGTQVAPTDGPVAAQLNGIVMNSSWTVLVWPNGPPLGPLSWSVIRHQMFADR